MGIHLTFKDTFKLFSKEILSFYNPAGSAQEVSCFTFLPTCRVVRVFNCSFSNSWEGASSCGFYLHFLMINDEEHIFMCLFATYLSSLMKYLFKSFFPFLFGFLIVEFWEFIIYCEFKSLIRYVICKDFLPICTCVLPLGKN